MSGRQAMVGFILIILALFYSSLFTVDQRFGAILFQLGEVKEDHLKPGLHFKIPMVQNVRWFDRRIQTLDAPPARLLTYEKKHVLVDAFVKWRIEDMERFYRSTGGGTADATLRLGQIIKDGLRNEFGKRTIQEAVSEQRVEIMASLTGKAGAKADSLGIEVLDVRIKRIDLPEGVSESVFRRMEAERKSIAKQLRAEGSEASEIIRAQADRENEVLLAKAFSEAESIRAEGDALASDIYARAYSQSPEFFDFYQRIKVYKESFLKGDNHFLIDAQGLLVDFDSILEGSGRGIKSGE